MDVSNDTEGKSATVVLADKDGRQYVAPILKYSCDIALDGGVTLAEKPSEIDFAYTYNGEAASTSSIRRPSQLFEQKPGTDVVVIAEAHPPSGREVTTMDVMLRMGPVRNVPIRGHEPIEILGGTPEGVFSCQLPRIAPGLSSVIVGKRQEHRPRLDTVLSNVVERRGKLSFRAAIRVPKKLEMFERVLVFEKEIL